MQALYQERLLNQKELYQKQISEKEQRHQHHLEAHQNLICLSKVTSLLSTPLLMKSRTYRNVNWMICIRNTLLVCSRMQILERSLKMRRNTWKFLSTGLAFRSMAFSFKLAHNTVRAIVYETCEAIWECFVGDHMPAPTTESFKSSADEFMATWGFPNCVGCIDGKHVRVRCPTHSGSMFYNYKQFFL